MCSWSARPCLAAVLAGALGSTTALAAERGKSDWSGTTTLTKSNAESGATAPTPAAAGPAAHAVATAAQLFSDDKRTTFRIDLSRGVTAEIFTLANPYRVVVDLPDVSFGLAPGTGQQGRGLVRAFRYGLFAERKARIVIDTQGPVRIDQASMVAAPGKRGVIFTFDMIETAAATFGAGTGAARPENAAAPKPAAAEAIGRPAARGRPVIVIDPGHGGIDGGAVGASKLLEKEVVLAVAKELRRQLTERGRFDVRMTREEDVFVPLDARLKSSRDGGAELFISLHADSLSSTAGQTIRGATVYTLSERASDEQARRMAEKENASDLVAGLPAGGDGEADHVKDILIDLLRRETANFSADFSNLLVGKLKSAVSLSRAPQRSAAFKVLKQPHAPSVLVELGFLSDAEDERLLGSPAWQRKAAGAIAASVESFFAKRTVSAP